MNGLCHMVDSVCTGCTFTVAISDQTTSSISRNVYFDTTTSFVTSYGAPERCIVTEGEHHHQRHPAEQHEGCEKHQFRERVRSPDGPRERIDTNDNTALARNATVANPQRRVI